MAGLKTAASNGSPTQNLCLIERKYQRMFKNGSIANESSNFKPCLLILHSSTLLFYRAAIADSPLCRIYGKPHNAFHVMCVNFNKSAQWVFYRLSWNTDCVYLYISHWVLTVILRWNQLGSRTHEHFDGFVSTLVFSVDVKGKFFWLEQNSLMSRTLSMLLGVERKTMAFVNAKPARLIKVNNNRTKHITHSPISMCVMSQGFLMSTIFNIVHASILFGSARYSCVGVIPQTNKTGWHNINSYAIATL